MTSGAFGIEIASVEHPVLLDVVIEEAKARGIPITRVSQGSGARMLTDAEIGEMVTMGAEAGIDVYLFSSDRNSFEPLVDPMGADQIRGEEAFDGARAELDRCADTGVAGVLLADIGLLAAAGAAREAGDLKLGLKTSVSMAPVNAATARLYQELGATSINVAASSSVDDLGAMRAALGPETALDIYFESPNDLGGGMKYRQAARCVRELGPVNLKAGLRNAQSLYPYGKHLESYAIETMREKVRRVEIMLCELERAGIERPGFARPNTAAAASSGADGGDPRR